MVDHEIRDTIYQYCQRLVDDFGKEDVTSLTPARVDNYLTRLSGYSALLEEEMGELEIYKATNWLAFRDGYRSNVDAKMAFDGTVEGLRLIKLKRTLNAVDKVISACKNRLRRLENESFNRY